MIHRLRGQLVEKNAEGIVVDCGGVGYFAAASQGTVRALPSIGEECVLHTRMVVREDAMLLFGFASRDERAVFDALVAVSKIGPKLALAVLSHMPPAEVAEGRSPRRHRKVRLRSGPRQEDGGACCAGTQGQEPRGLRTGDRRFGWRWRRWGTVPRSEGRAGGPGVFAG